MNIKSKFEEYIITKKDKIRISSKDIKQGDIFLALRGKNFHGNKFIKSSFRNGAKFCLTDNRDYSYNDKVIYVKGGPVRVKGFYKGRYTIVTDEYTTYRRHAWPTTNNPPIDTIWNNIWLTGDLVNVDAKGTGDSSDGLQNIGDGNMREFQPSPDCEGGSENSMGLVSGANIYIANTHDNGAKNRNKQGNIIIN